MQGEEPCPPEAFKTELPRVSVVGQMKTGWKKKREQSHAGGGSPGREKMSEKKQVPLRLKKELYDALCKWAEDDFRSVNGQIE